VVVELISTRFHLLRACRIGPLASDRDNRSVMAAQNQASCGFGDDNDSSYLFESKSPPFEGLMMVFVILPC